MAPPLKEVWAELHCHTVASACSELEMIPPLIVERARELGLGLLGITDHHSVENVAAVQQAAERERIHVLPGMEVQTREEVHVVCLFDELERALGWQAWIWEHLPSLPNREAFFGGQVVVDSGGEFVRTNDRLLQTSVDLGFDELFQRVEEWGGIAIPAHVDRSRFSLFANLGLVPDDVSLVGAEISRRMTAEEARERYPSLLGMGLIQSGDAHRLSEMMASTRLVLAEPTVAELRLAFLGREGRRILEPPGQLGAG
jgi:PHP family Zn ribbon phosphoesterase